MSTNKSARSRFSSPLHPNSPSSNNRGMTMEGQRSFMQRWLEPPIQNKASFQEAGLIRGGVVENMAPLGTLPKSAMHKKSPVNGDGLPAPPPTRTRIVLKKPYVTTTPMPRESVPRIREESVDEVENEVDAAPLSPLSQPVAPPAMMDDGEDEEYVPKKSKTRTSSAHVTPITVPSSTRRHSARRRSARPSPTPVVVTVPAISTPAQSSPVQAPAPSPKPPTFRAPASTLGRVPDKELADKVVETAVDEALRHYRYPTAWALRLLYDENSSDPHFVSMIEDIFHQRADVETIKEFNRLVSDKKKGGKKDNKGCYYFEPPSTGSRFTPQKPKPAPYSDLVKMDFSHFPDETLKGHVNKKVKLDQDAIIDAATMTPSKVNGNGTGNGNENENGVSSHKGLTNRSPHKSPNKSPSKGRKTRSGSVSSSSSLSSVPDDVPDDFEGFMDLVDDDLSVARPIAAAAEANNAQIPADSIQPISDQQKKPAAKKKNGASPKHTPSQSTRQHPSSRDSSMPAVVITNGTSHLQHTPKRQQTPAFKFTSKFGDADLSEPLVQKKLNNKFETRSATEDIVEESFIREPLLDDSLPFELAVPPPPTTEQYRSSRTPALSSRAARAAKRNHDEMDDSISPTTQSFRAADLEASSARNSRAATPASNLRSNKKPRAGLRVKNSPMKKKGTSAGIPRSAVDRPSPIGFGPPHHQDDNDDSCYTCGGNGELVCCDGCNYSFHFLCIDPPMDEGHMPDEWYCNECKHSYTPPFSGEYQGPFRSLFSLLDRKNTRAFRLPEDVRELFEDVRTGPEGEYEEAVPPKPKTTKKGVEEPFDFFKVKNADGRPVLCFRCNKATSDNRPIIPCSVPVCGLNWHLECLDPPLAVPPVPRTWRCPCHAEEMLAELPERLAPAHRHRRIKNAPIIEHSYSRGMANDGYIEIENDDDSEDDAHAWRKYKGFGQTHRLSAKGVKLDFISRVQATRKRKSAPISPVSPTPAVQPRVRSLEEQQAALNLAQLARSDGINLLQRAMISQASPDIVSLMASGDAKRIASGSLTSVDTVSLQAMLAQAESLQQGIRQLLGSRNITNDATLKATKKEASLSFNSPMSYDPIAYKDGKQRTVAKGVATNPDVEGNKLTKNESAMQID
ncbi:uncharacterized protein GGS22DRAFT_106297 [Annulohypoxylon maeteangense]|uniref:uncharacterized protein n=1 Tax=Annulohypoxylon maeteangense TaxID=1927788 RepID=UPI002008EA60|nr:uncharacterized protein GGS22DRAFT_106297 [Annulohypoxylon maeteangense]KAI0887218.1 hypothetical protein GGS22DRAFT_106297 [Annulohypoxylon maeteangense]